MRKEEEKKEEEEKMRKKVEGEFSGSVSRVHA